MAASRAAAAAAAVADGAPRVVLHSFFRSTASWRVRIALTAKKVPYRYEAVNILKPPTPDPRAFTINPLREVPVLEIDGLVLTQSLPIIEYLEETRPEVPLLPKSAALRAKTRIISEIINSGIQPRQTPAMQKYIAAEQRQAYLSHWIRRGLRACEHEMRGASGRFTIGDSITMADCFVLPQLAFARRFNVDVSDFSELLRVAANLEQVEAVRAAAPEAQPDKDSAK